MMKGKLLTVKRQGVDLGQLQADVEAATKKRKSAERAYERAGQVLQEADDQYRASLTALRGGFSAVQATNRLEP